MLARASSRGAGGAASPGAVAEGGAGGPTKSGTAAAGRPWARVSTSTGCRAPPAGVVVACRCASWAVASAAVGARASRRVLIPYEKKFRRLMASRSSKRNPSLKSVASQLSPGRRRATGSNDAHDGSGTSKIGRPAVGTKR